MRIRTVKPEFWRSDDVGRLARGDRLLFIGLWSYVDDNGVGRENVAFIAADLFAHDLEVSPRECLDETARGLDELENAGLIVRYGTPDGRRYLFIVNWHHQKIDRPLAGRYPTPDEVAALEKAQPDQAFVELQRIPRADSSKPRAVSSKARADSASVTGEQGNRGTGEQTSTSDEVEVAPEAPNATKPKAKRAVTLPAKWQPNDGHLAFGAEHNIDVPAEVDRFRDYHLHKGTLGKDWDAGFRTWLRNAVGYRERDAAAAEPPKQMTVRERNEARIRAAGKR